MNRQPSTESPLVFKQDEVSECDMWDVLQEAIEETFSHKTIDLTERATLNTDLPFNNRLNDDGDLINETEQ